MSDTRSEEDRPHLSGPELIESEHAYALLVEAVEDYAIFLLDTDGRVLTWNRGAERIKQYAPSDIIGKHFSAFYPEEDRERGLPDQMLAAARTEGRVSIEGWRVRQDGSRFWADVVITALHDESGELFGFAKVTRDLTERRENEERERRLRAAENARRAADDAVRLRDRFLSVAAHELRTPINTLRLSTDLLRRQRATGALDDDALGSALARIHKAGERLTALVNELLDVGKLTAGEIPLDLAEIDLGDLVSGIVELYRGIHEARRIEFEAQPGVIVRADASRIEQVVSNLIDNALKYSREPSPVAVSVRPDAAHGDEVMIEVVDQGIGMDPDAVRAMEQPFTRGANTINMEGLGLGLFISHGIVTRHGGRIEMRSQGPDQGTTAAVWLPRDVVG
jgi:PAS domain S-box-containing protein